MSVIEFLTGVNVNAFVSCCIKAEALDGAVFVTSVLNFVGIIFRKSLELVFLTAEQL